jgi:hypothetical protein
MNVEYRTLKRDGNCNCCYTTIQKDKDLCIIFDNKKNGAYTIVLCPECIKMMGDKIDGTK